MSVKKKGSKWFPVGKSGKLWKTGFATEAKAKKALTKANKYFSSMKRKGTKKRKRSGSKPSKKKKTKKRKSSSKKKTTGGGKTATSGLSPVNKKGLKLVTTLGIIAALATVFTKPTGSSMSPYDAAKARNYDLALRLLRRQASHGGVARDFAAGGLIVWGGAKVVNKKSIAFVQFS